MKYLKIIIMIPLVLIGYAIGWLIGDSNQFCEEQKQIKITITNEFINVREYANAYTDKLGQVKQGDKFKVIEKFTGNPVYDWYLIEYEEDKFGWIASEKEYPYVEEEVK